MVPNIIIKSRKNRLKLLIAAAVSTAVAVLVICLSAAGDSGSVDLNKCGGVSGFLSRFSLEYQSLISSRQVLLPQKDDEAFAQYGEFQSKLGFNILKFSGKRVEERYLKLKNKTDKGNRLYAVVYIYKEKVIAAHLTSLEQGSEPMPLGAFSTQDEAYCLICQKIG